MPIILSFKRPKHEAKGRRKRFRFEELWLYEDDYCHVVQEAWNKVHESYLVRINNFIKA